VRYTKDLKTNLITLKVKWGIYIVSVKMCLDITTQKEQEGYL